MIVTIRPQVACTVIGRSVQIYHRGRGMRWRGMKVIMQMRDVHAGEVHQSVTLSEKTVKERAAEELRKAAQRKLEDDFKRHKLGQPAPIEVPWALVKAAKGHTGALFPNTGDVTGLPELLTSLPVEQRQLVVLGAPGAGKSILSLLLAQKLLPVQDSADPVPIVLSLSSWRPGVGLDDWVAQRAASLVPALGTRRRRLLAEAARDLIDERRLMPLLDGLDELPEALRGPAIDSIDAAIGKGIPLVVSCRAAEYEEAGLRTGAFFTSAAVLELGKVSPDDAFDYLTDSVISVEHWKGVFEALADQPHSAVAQAFRSPLMLYLARTAYRDPSSTPERLLEIKSEAAVETHLLDSYLPAIYSDHSRYSTKRASRYLKLIADQIGRDSTRDFAWWQLGSTGVSVMVSLLFGGIWGWFFHALFGPVLAAVIGVTAGFIGYWIHRTIRSNLLQVYVFEGSFYEPNSSLFRYSLIGFLSGVAAVCVTGLTAGGLLIFWVGVDPSVARRYAIPFGVVSGFATLLSSAWGVYRASHLWFWGTRRLPRRVGDFLRDAHALGVLRQTGTVYQFRHSKLQDQLSGFSDKPSRSAYTGNQQPGKLAILFLPFVPSAVQMILPVLAVICVYVVILAGGTEHPWTVSEGDNPRSRIYPGACSQDSVICPSTVEHTWTLSRNSSRTAFLGANDRNRTIAWSGSISMKACRGASVEVTLSLGEAAPISFTLNNGSSWDADVHSKLVRSGEKQPSIYMRRMDDRQCNSSVTWFRPVFREDRILTIRNRLNDSL
ncbi:NACHT domain-containing protein [Streptomyces sp. NPDC004227]